MKRSSRRQFMGSIAGGAVAVALGHQALAETGLQLPTPGAGVPAGAKAGPLGLSSRPVGSKGSVPVSIVIQDAAVDAEVERTKIVNGQMLDPSGPWIVAWYESTGRAGETDSNNNCLMAGHVDYWDVGPAVFQSVSSLTKGASMVLAGEDGDQYTYIVEYVERIPAEPTAEKLLEITGPTDYPALTLITCGGTFDYNAGVYLERDVIRGRLQVPEGSGVAESTHEPDKTPDPDETTTSRASATVATDGLHVRSEPSTTADVVATLNRGDVVAITGEPKDADGYTWYPVRTEDGKEGWVAADFITLDQ